MSHLLSRALSVLLVASACSSAKPPEASVPEAPAPTEPVPAEPASPAVESNTGLGASPAAEASVQTLFVREQLVDCEAEGVRKCLQVREKETDDWRNFYAPIDGFEYQESHAYELRVEVTRDPNPPADAASLRYRLLDVISKRKVDATGSAE